jgi:hypothetical protein
LCLAALLSSKAVDPSSSPIPKSKWLNANNKWKFHFKSHCFSVNSKVKITPR